jgi:tRNA(adenine34) deaminase
MMPDDEHTRWMNHAHTLAARAAGQDEVPIGAVLVSSSGEILSEGFNQREQSHRTTAHAEIIALENYNQKFATWRLPAGSRLYVTIEPCLMCAGALLWARLECLYYGGPDTKSAGIERIRNLIEAGVYDHRLRSLEGGLDAERCSKLIQDYFRQKRKKDDCALTLQNQTL